MSDNEFTLRLRSLPEVFKIIQQKIIELQLLIATTVTRFDERIIYCADCDTYVDIRKFSLCPLCSKYLNEVVKNDKVSTL